ncbi:MAG: GNAT family N-acetyltransferase [candidate division Zixibacteria bacterium]|nr:GNAT family N-acetyltransferase [candidate division Zixibacteria bacterium]
MYLVAKTDLIKDENEILRFWRENFPGWPDGKYSMFYVNNPYGQAISWLVRETSETEAIAANAILPRRMNINGDFEMEAIVSDFGVNIDHRGKGAALLLQNTLVEYHNQSDFGFLYATPNHISEKVFRKANFKIIGKVIRMIKIFKTEEYIKRFIKIPFIAKPLSKPLDFILKLISREGRFKKKEEYKTEILSEFDKRFDDLWSEAMPNYSVIGERTSNFLNWRFTNCPYIEYKIFTLTHIETNRIHGYIVYQSLENEIYFEDLFQINTDEALDILLSEFLIYQRSQGANTVTFYYFGCDKVISKFHSFGFSTRKDYHVMAVRLNPKCTNESMILDRNNWHFLNGDNDGASEGTGQF